MLSSASVTRGKLHRRILHGILTRSQAISTSKHGVVEHEPAYLSLCVFIDRKIYLKIRSVQAAYLLHIIFPPAVVADRLAHICVGDCGLPRKESHLKELCDNKQDK